MKVELIKEQINWVDNWTNNLISDIHENDYGIVENLNTSINWLIGHIIISKYFHSVQSIWPEKYELVIELKQQVLEEVLFKYYFAGSNPLEPWKEGPNKEQLLGYKEEIDFCVTRILNYLSENTLSEKTEIENPVAKTKYDAFTFTYKHQMWHNGQIALVKRIIK